MKKYWYNFKFWFDGIFNPHVVGYKMEPVVQFIKKAYQICTPWFGHKRWLMHEVCCNSGKLLETGLSMVSQRTRDGNCEYYLLTAYFGRVKFYKILYVDKKSKKPTNAFLSLVVLAVCGKDHSSEIIRKKVCLYKSWAFTRHQVLEALLEIRNKSKSLHWNTIAEEKRVYELAENAVKYLNGKRVYFTYDGMSEEEAEKELRVQIYLMQRDVKDWDTYTDKIQECMELVLDKPTPERNKKLKTLLQRIMTTIKQQGYKSTWDLYFD